MDIHLTEDEYRELLLMLGYGLGAAVQLGNQERVDRFLFIVNRVCANSPNSTTFSVLERGR